MTCLYCCKKLRVTSKKYCSNKCQIAHQYNLYIERWKAGQETGSRGINAQNISRYLQRYLREKYQEECAVCGWNKPHPLTGRVPLEIDHVDGNAENNSEGNLRLLCPNCHSLTDNFRNLNRGRGRQWRRAKYTKS